MLKIYFHNDGTNPNEKLGNYSIEVFVNSQPIYSGRLEGHTRGDFRNLIIEWANQLQLEQRKENENV